MTQGSTHRSFVKLFLIVALCLASTNCIHKTGTITPWERVHTYNAALADANGATEQGLEAVVTAGLLPAQNAEPLIAWTGQVAALHQQITAILAQGQATQANIASVTALIGQIKASFTALPISAFGIKNPKSQQTFRLDVDNILTLADAVLTSLQAVTP